jgi:octaprenyl-diphosphate synthase
MVECHTPGVLKILADASALIAEGEVMQLSHSHRWDLEMEMYLEIIERKTSVLFEAACCVGAMAGNATPEQVYHIAAFGRFFGMIFQMTDDLLDYFPIRDYGKQLGDDFFHGKITLPILMLRDVVPQKKWLNHLFDTTTKRTFDDFKALKDVFETYTIFDTCMDFIACYADKAIHALKEIPESHLRDRLERCVQHVIDRCYDADKAREAIA